MEWPDIKGHMHDVDRDWIYSKLIETKAKRVVEIGCYCGRTTYVFSKYVSEHGGTLDCVDSWEDRPDRPDALRLFMHNLAFYNFDNLVKVHCQKSIDFADRYNGMADFVFVDSDHTYKGIKSDIEKWFPKTKYLCGHDVYMVDIQRALTEYAVLHHLIFRKTNGSECCWELIKR